MSNCVRSEDIERRQAAGQTLTHNQKRYLRILARGDPDRCDYCGVELTDESRTIDHRVAVLRGGSSELVNLCLACLDCNSRKSSMSPAKFRAKLTEERRIAEHPLPPSLGVKTVERSKVSVSALLSEESRAALASIGTAGPGDP